MMLTRLFGAVLPLFLAFFLLFVCLAQDALASTAAASGA